jgi:AcrR family transcriptional regulator
MKELARAPGPGLGAQTYRGMARQNLILKVAAELFAESGYEHVSITDIGVAAGVTGPAIYRYFPGKEDILISIFQRLFSRSTDATQEIAELNLPPREALVRLIELQIDMATTEPEKIRIVDREMRSLPSHVAMALRQQRDANLAVWVDVASRARPDLEAEEVRVTVHAVLALVNSISLRRRSERADPKTIQRLREMALYCFLGAEAVELTTP